MRWIKGLFGHRSGPPAGGGTDFVEALSDFTPRAQQVLSLANKEARRLGHAFIGTEHVLLGIVALGQGTAVAVLGKMGMVDLETLRQEIQKHVGRGPDLTKPGQSPYTPRVKRVLAFAAKEAKSLHHTYVGTEHILLGLLRDADGVAGRVLIGLGINSDAARRYVLQELDPNYAPPGRKEPVQQENDASKVRRDIDIGKRYDVFYREGQQEAVYRNVLFKGIRTLFPRNEHDVFSQYLEIELPDGRTIFIARSALTRFCEHGTEGPA